MPSYVTTTVARGDIQSQTMFILEIVSYRLHSPLSILIFKQSFCPGWTLRVKPQNVIFNKLGKTELRKVYLARPGVDYPWFL